MSATWTRGTTYAANGTVTETNLAELIENATLAGVDRANCVSGSRPISSRGSAPQDLGVLEPWCHEDQLWPLTKLEDGSLASVLPSATLMSLDASSADVSAGDLLAPSSYTTVPVVTKVVTGSPWRVFAVAAHDATAGNSVVGILHGLVRVRVSDTVVAGEMLRVSTTVDGQAERVGAVGSGSGVLAFALAISTSAGGFVWAKKRR